MKNRRSSIKPQNLTRILQGEGSVSLQYVIKSEEAYSDLTGRFKG
jgi:hypothetical protein